MPRHPNNLVDTKPDAMFIATSSIHPARDVFDMQGVISPQTPKEKRILTGPGLEHSRIKTTHASLAMRPTVRRLARREGKTYFSKKRRPLRPARLTCQILSTQ